MVLKTKQKQTDYFKTTSVLKIDRKIWSEAARTVACRRGVLENVEDSFQYHETDLKFII